MFDSIVSKITTVVCNSECAVTAAMRGTPWFASLTIVALILIW